MLAEEAAWATLTNEMDIAREQQEKKEKDDIERFIKFEKHQLARHLKPLYVRLILMAGLLAGC